MIKVKCINAKRSQGTLTEGSLYVVCGKRTATSKDGVTRDEIRVLNNHNTFKWYDAARFEEVKTQPATPEVNNKNNEEVKKMVQTTTNTNMGANVPKKLTLRGFLQSQGISDSLIDSVNEFRTSNSVDSPVRNRLISQPSLYIGGEVMSMAITALLEGRNVLLRGPKATGKNTLAEFLAFMFGRPIWDVSFHTYIDAGSLIGSETFRNNQVEFRPGAVYNCALYGGFGILDEINMAKPEAVAVLHSILDDRRVIDVPGYDRLKMSDATRFIATMNYGYVGTKELNEALVSRFVVIDVPMMTEEQMLTVLKSKFPGADDNMLKHFIGVFTDLQTKAQTGEISTKSVDFRGIIDTLKAIKRGLKPRLAVTMGVINKCFDDYEIKVVRDTVFTRIADSWETDAVFPPEGSITVEFK